MDELRFEPADYGFKTQEAMEHWFHRLSPGERYEWMEEQVRLFKAAHPNCRKQHDFRSSQSVRVLRVPQD